VLEPLHRGGHGRDHLVSRPRGCAAFGGVPRGEGARAVLGPDQDDNLLISIICDPCARWHTQICTVEMRLDVAIVGERRLPSVGRWRGGAVRPEAARAHAVQGIDASVEERQTLSAEGTASTCCAAGDGPGCWLIAPCRSCARAATGWARTRHRSTRETSPPFGEQRVAESSVHRRAVAQRPPGPPPW